MALQRQSAQMVNILLQAGASRALIGMSFSQRLLQLSFPMHVLKVAPR